MTAHQPSVYFSTAVAPTSCRRRRRATLLPDAPPQWVGTRTLYRVGLGVGSMYVGALQTAACASQVTAASRAEPLTRRSIPADTVFTDAAMLTFAHSQCDGEKPACARCARAGKRCHGYKAPFSVMHAEEVYASGRCKRPQGPRAPVQTEEVLTCKPSRNVSSEALAYYMRNHFAPEGQHPSASEHFRDALCRFQTSAPALVLAVRAVSLAIFSRVLRHPEAANMASVSYHRSLRALYPTLPTLERSRMDSYLLTVHFLARYEDSLHTLTTSRNVKTQGARNRVHLTGIAAGLRYWSASPTSDHTATTIVKHSRRMLRKAALLGQFDLPEWAHDGTRFGEREADLALDRALVGLINLRSRMKTARFDKGESCRDIEVALQHLETLYDEATAIDGCLWEWIQSYAESAFYSKHNVIDHESWPTRTLHHPCVYISRDGGDAVVRVQYYGYRMLANHLRLRILDILQRNGGFASRGRLFECRHVMNSLAYDLAASIPFCLQRIRFSEGTIASHDNVTVFVDQDPLPYLAEPTAMPLMVASVSSYVVAAYRSWFRSQLRDVGRLTGYGIIEHVADSETLEL